MTSLAAIPPSIEEDETDDDDTDRNFNSDDDSFHDALSAEEDEEEDEDVVTPSRDVHERIGSDTDGTAEKHTDDSDDNRSIAAAYIYDVESAVEAEESRTVWSHEPIASYLVAAATPAPAQQTARLRQVSGDYNARAGRGVYVDAPLEGEDLNIPPALQAAHHALLSQTHMQAEQTLSQTLAQTLAQTNFFDQIQPTAPYQPTEQRTRPKLPPVFVPPPTHQANLPNQHVPRTPGPGDPSLGALEQALEFLAAERTRVASQLDSSIEDYAYRTNEGKRRRRKRKKGVRTELRPDGGIASIPLGAINVGGAGFASNLSLNKVHTPAASRSGNSNHSGSAHERTDTAVPSPSEGTSFSSSSADPRTARHSYLRDGEVPPMPIIGQQRSSGRQSSFGSGYSRPGINPNMLAHEIIASYSVPTPPPTGRRPVRRGQHGRGPSYDAPRAPGRDAPPPPMPDARMHSIGQRLSGGSGSGSSPTGVVPVTNGESKVARLRMLAANLAGRFPEDAGALRRAAEGGGGTSFEPESLLYVFVDHSNILVGFLEYLKKNPQLLPPSIGSPKRLKPKILHTALVLLLERGRPCARRILVASSPLHQTLDGVVGMGYEVSVLQRVEIKENDGASPRPRHVRGPGVESSEDDIRNGIPPPPGSSRTSSSGRRSAHHRHPSSASDMSAPSASRSRFREEAVDELLQLKLLQTILDTPPATIVLATGDGASSQFNPDGFTGCVKRAVERGWRVELVAWDQGVNRVWRELEQEVKATPAARGRGSFVIISLEEWVTELIDV
ncbi:hypothetical protein RhiJN_06417 [Ceratobasidium sp. AG-Ba]|nr:hypothetical protein RhiJN_06417 [Ceratobasidium sp. AG-Ba]QRW07331.1 hypothetical protein RhiLY_06330 [Ceratobasidium sp. AG-Ba]